MGTYLPVYAAALTALALLCFFASAYAMRMRAAARSASRLLCAVRERQSALLEASRALVDASRESADAVFDALYRAIRGFEPGLDALLVFAPDASDLRCTYAQGPRSEHYPGARVARGGTSLAARAALCGHHVALASGETALIPSDRSAIAVPMHAGGELCAVVYASGAQRLRLDAAALASAVSHASAPYALARDREADRRHATFDALTGLYTPRAFRDQLAREAGDAAAQSVIALWFVDTDSFKEINDRLGHAAGDAVLQQMAVLLRAHTRENIDLAARNGGDEFCAILRRTQKVEAIDRAAAFCAAVRAHDFGCAGAVTVSVGVAAYPYDAAGAAQLLEAADGAMYHSKRSGRDCVSFCCGAAAFAVYR
jgi:diguanylate cyclase (GGDEF)-like protein